MVCENILRYHAQMFRKGAFSHKIDYITIFRRIYILKDITNCITGLRVTATLLYGWIFLIGQSGEASVEGLLSTGPTPPSLHRLTRDLGCMLCKPTLPNWIISVCYKHPKPGNIYVAKGRQIFVLLAQGNEH